MLRAYRLVYPDSPHAPPQLWESAQPYIHHLIVNARTFNRCVVQRCFRDWDACACENATIWERHYRPRPLYQPWGTWDAWLEEYRSLVMDMQNIYEEHSGRMHQDQCQARQNGQEG